MNLRTTLTLSADGDYTLLTPFVTTEYLVRVGPLADGDFAGTTVSFSYMNGVDQTPYLNSDGTELQFTTAASIILTAANETIIVSVSGLGESANLELFSHKIT